MPVSRSLIIEKKPGKAYLISIRYKGSVATPNGVGVDKVLNKFIIKKKGDDYILDENSNIYVTRNSLLGILKDIVFFKAFKKLINDKKMKRIEVLYTLREEDYITELNEFIKE